MNTWDYLKQMENELWETQQAEIEAEMWVELALFNAKPADPEPWEYGEIALAA